MNSLLISAAVVLAGACVAVSGAAAGDAEAPARPLPAAVGRAPGDGPATVMPWLCLERCGNASTIALNVAQLRTHAALLNDASFEAYDLAPNGSLVNNGFSAVAPALASAGLRTWAMITTVDIYRLRSTFAQPAGGDGFIAQAARECAARRFSGFNIDFEPCQDKRTAHVCNSHDAAAYAAWLGRLAAALHGAGCALQVCAASWSPFWNYTLVRRPRSPRSPRNPRNPHSCTRRARGAALTRAASACVAI